MEKIVNNNTLPSPAISIGNASANSTNPEVAAPGNNVYVFGQILMARRVKMQIYFLTQVATMEDHLISRLI